MVDFTVEIYGRSYRVIHGDHKLFARVADFTEEEAKGLLGAHRYANQIILIKQDENNRYSFEVQLETFIHECVHAIYGRFGYHQEGYKFDTEFLCDFIATHIEELTRLRDEYTQVYYDSQPFMPKPPLFDSIPGGKPHENK